jgi:CheY-like chemotaxis protein
MAKAILVIDDNGPIRRLIGMYLRQEGYEVVEVEGGEEGIEVLESQPIDLVLLDMVMPGLNGVETLMNLRMKFPRLRVIAMSGGDGNGPEPYLAIALGYGANSVLRKPFGRYGLLGVVRKTVESTNDE